MASGNITLYIESVDYPSGRGAQYSNLNARWNVTDSGWLTLTEESYSTNTANWWICSSVPTDINRYYVKWEVQFKPDGGNWQSLYSDKVAPLGPCSSYTYQTGTNVKAMMEGFCNSFPGVQLNVSGELRVICGANLAPAPDAGYPYAFPNDVYSESSQVPVHIDVSWDATLRYNATGGSPTPGTQTQRVTGDTATFIVSSTIPSKYNHRFDGWSRGGRLYHGGDSISIAKSNPDQTLSAMWTEYYRPGSRKINGTASSLNRSGGVCDRKGYGEMKTLAGGVETGDPPKRKSSGTWYNQKRIGAE